MTRFLLLLDHIADRILGPSARKAVEQGLVRLALGLFILHLLLFLLHSAGWLPFPMPESLFGHPLHVLYTPFSVILVAEVYLLVYHLPASFARSMGKQLEIVSLIEIRSVFKDLSALQASDSSDILWPWHDPFSRISSVPSCSVHHWWPSTASFREGLPDWRSRNWRGSSDSSDT